MQVAGFFYPPVALVVAIGAILGQFPYRFVEFVMIAHFPLGAFGMYKFCRDQSLGILSSVAAGIVFAFGGFFLSHIENATMLYGFFWVPLLFLAANRSVGRSTLEYPVMAGVILGMVALTPFTRTLAYLAAAYIVYVFLKSVSRGLHQFQLVRFFVNIVATATVALGVAAVEIIPAVELLRNSTVTMGGSLVSLSNLPYKAMISTGLSPVSLITLIIPNFFGSVTGNYNGPGDITLNYLYVGVFPLVLIVSGFKLGLERAELRRYYTWIMVGLVSLVIGLGGVSALPQLLFMAGGYALPGGGSIGVLVFFQFSVAFLSGIVIDVLGRRSSEITRRLLSVERQLARVTSLVFVLVLFAYVLTALAGDYNALSRFSDFIIFAILLAGSLLFIHMFRKGAFGSRQLRGLLIAFIFIELMSFNSVAQFNADPVNPDTFVTPVTARNPVDTRLLRFLQADPTVFRVSFETYDGNWGNDGTGNFIQIWDIQATRGYWPVKLRTSSHFVSLFGEPSMPDVYTRFEHNSNLLDLYNVKYVVTSQLLEEIDPHVDLSKFEIVYNDYYMVYLNRLVLPRAFLAPCLISLPDDNSVAEALTSPHFDPRRHVLSSDPMAKETGTWWSQTCEPFKEVPQIVEYTPTKITMLVSSHRDGYLVISDNYYPGWTASLDGRASGIVRADLTFRAIRITAGTHTLSVFYDPVVFELGFSLTIMSIAGLAFFFRRHRWKMPILSRPGNPKGSVIPVPQTRVSETTGARNNDVVRMMFQPRSSA